MFSDNKNVYYKQINVSTGKAECSGGETAPVVLCETGFSSTEGGVLGSCPGASPLEHHWECTVGRAKDAVVPLPGCSWGRSADCLLPQGVRRLQRFQSGRLSQLSRLAKE